MKLLYKTWHCLRRMIKGWQTRFSAMRPVSPIPRPGTKKYTVPTYRDCSVGDPWNFGTDPYADPGGPKHMRMRIRNTGTFTSFFKEKVIKKLHYSRNQGFSYYFCLMMEGSGAWSILVTNGSGCGSGRPKTVRIYGSGSWSPTLLGSINFDSETQTSNGFFCAEACLPLCRVTFSFLPAYLSVSPAAAEGGAESGPSGWT